MGPKQIVVFSGIDGNLENLELISDTVKDFDNSFTCYLGDFKDPRTKTDHSKLPKHCNVVKTTTNTETFPITHNIEELLIGNTLFKNTLDYYMNRDNVEPNGIKRHLIGLAKKHPDVNIFFFGNQNFPRVFVLDRDTSNIAVHKINSNAKLIENGNAYFVTPGFAGYSLGQSNVAIYLTQPNAVLNYTLLDLRNLGARRDLLIGFEKLVIGKETIEEFTQIVGKADKPGDLNYYKDFKEVMQILKLNLNNCPEKYVKLGLAIEQCLGNYMQQLSLHYGFSKPTDFLKKYKPETYLLGLNCDRTSSLN